MLTFGSISWLLMKCYHGIEVFYLFDWSGIFGNFLIETVAEIVGWIGGDNEGLPSRFGLQSSQTATCSSLPNPTLSTDEYPTKRLLV